MTVERAMLWLEQARSDARTADALRKARAPMVGDDVGCHVALLCAQSIEKCVKGCMLLVGRTPALTHDVEAEIAALTRAAKQRNQKRPHQLLAPLVRATGVQRTAKLLLAWIPGTASPADANTEYPWPAGAETDIPFAHSLFEHAREHAEWCAHARKLSDEAMKIAEAIQRS